MNEIKWYSWADGEDCGEPTPTGVWAHREDVEALQKELQEMTAKALAAVWLLPEDENVGKLRLLAKEAHAVLMGEDKKTIAKLQDELRYAREVYQHVTRPPPPGIGSVYARDFKKNIDIPLGIFEIRHDADGHAHIGVHLP